MFPKSSENIGKNFGIVGLEPRTCVSFQFFSKNRGGLAWIKSPTKDVVVVFFTSP